MYKLENNTHVDIAAELKELARYASQRWDNVPSIDELFSQIAAAAHRDARCWFDRFRVGDALEIRKKCRRELLKTVSPESEGLEEYYDHSCVWLDALSTAADTLEEAGKAVDGAWDYGRRTSAVYALMRKKFPGLEQARPRGWDALAACYNDFDGMEEYCKNDQRSDEADFKGANTASVSASGFEGRTALPYVMYEEKCQGRSAAEALVSSVYSHFLQIANHTNTQELLAALAQLPLRDDEPALVWGLTVASKQPLLSALIGVAAFRLSTRTAEQPAREALADSIRSLEEFASKPDAEKAAIQAAHERDTLAFMAALSTPEEDAEYEQTRALERNAALEQLKLMLPPLEQL